MDSLIEKAATLPVQRIKESLPPTFFNEIHNVGECLSVSWVGLFAGLWTPIQYAMGYASVELEESDWSEPTITWPLLHSPSGTRKSIIHKFVKGLIDFDESEDPPPRYKVNETTFENLGLVMEKNEGNRAPQGPQGLPGPPGPFL